MRLNFDHNFYKKIYPEFKNFTNYNIEKHYKLYGLKEGRMKNLVDFLERYPEFDYIWYKKNIERDTLDCVLYYYKIITQTRYIIMIILKTIIDIYIYILNIKIGYNLSYMLFKKRKKLLNIKSRNKIEEYRNRT